MDDQEKIQRLYSIHDSVADEFGPVFQSHSEAVAIRQHKMMLLKVQSEFRHEFSLYLVGFYDSKTGKIKAVEPTLVRVSLKDQVNVEDAR